ncbi:PPC domain-containing DNA-binding protein [Desulfovibrio sp. JC010]|uniref:PPC domain-containing DNA-binding protein n=1 Tax=Desulfovibrio sp. JC010 TaxID=2593641 RepID=UPI0013D1D358|nr:PPC domain-containing DNA-binding protein [Desulfovibrio sp. JC010]NDV28138.1 DNA-binding protein [Desulfovibrio sp. JC010]
MEYKDYGSKVLVRLDPGEEIVAGLNDVCEKLDIKLGCVSGIGAVNQATVGLFNPATKEYFSTTLEKDFEITNLTGNVSRMNGEVYLHLHVTLADVEHNAFGGHLNSAVVSATAEIWMDVVVGEVDRELSKKIGLNLLKF